MDQQYIEDQDAKNREICKKLVESNVKVSVTGLTLVGSVTAAVASSASLGNIPDCQETLGLSNSPAAENQLDAAAPALATSARTPAPQGMSVANFGGNPHVLFYNRDGTITVYRMGSSVEAEALSSSAVAVAGIPPTHHNDDESVDSASHGKSARRSKKKSERRTEEKHLRALLKESQKGQTKADVRAFVRKWKGKSEADLLAFLKKNATRSRSRSRSLNRPSTGTRRKSRAMSGNDFGDFVEPRAPRPDSRGTSQVKPPKRNARNSTGAVGGGMPGMGGMGGFAPPAPSATNQQVESAAKEPEATKKDATVASATSEASGTSPSPATNAVTETKVASNTQVTLPPAAAAAGAAALPPAGTAADAAAGAAALPPADAAGAAALPPAAADTAAAAAGAAALLPADADTDAGAETAAGGAGGGAAGAGAAIVTKEKESTPPPASVSKTEPPAAATAASATKDDDPQKSSKTDVPPSDVTKSLGDGGAEDFLSNLHWDAPRKIQLSKVLKGMPQDDMEAFMGKTWSHMENASRPRLQSKTETVPGVAIVTRYDLTHKTIFDLLAHAFVTKEPGLDISLLFSDDSKVGKAQGILNYFNKMASFIDNADKRIHETVSFQRFAPQFPNSFHHKLQALLTATPSSDTVFMQRPTEAFCEPSDVLDKHGEVMFAGSKVGSTGLTSQTNQQAARMAKSPELLAIPVMFPTELVGSEGILVENVGYFNKIEGKKTLKYSGAVESPFGSKTTIVAMQSEKKPSGDLHGYVADFGRALLAFSMLQNCTTIHTGDWGCGVNGGDPVVSRSIQSLANFHANSHKRNPNQLRFWGASKGSISSPFDTSKDLSIKVVQAAMVERMNQISRGGQTVSYATSAAPMPHPGGSTGSATGSVAGSVAGRVAGSVADSVADSVASSVAPAPREPTAGSIKTHDGREVYVISNFKPTSQYKMVSLGSAVWPRVLASFDEWQANPKADADEDRSEYIICAPAEVYEDEWLTMQAKTKDGLLIPFTAKLKKF